jgi:hypothetical protein
MVLVVIYLYFNVYMFALNRDADFQNVESRSQQLDVDRDGEILKVLNATATDGGGGGRIIINCTLINSGSVPIQIVRLWLQDYFLPAPNIVSLALQSQNVVLQPGVSKSQTFIATLQGAAPFHSFSMRLVTSRANVILQRING